MTDDILQTVVDIVESILSGKLLDASLLAKITSIPKDILVQLPDILSPILTPATAGLPLVSSVLALVLSLLKTLGTGLGSLQVRAVDLGGLDVNEILKQVGDALKGVEGITDDLLKTLLDLVGGLLSGE